MDNTNFDNNNYNNDSLDTTRQLPSSLQTPESVISNSPKTRSSAGKIVLLALCCSLVGGLAGAGAMTLVSAFRNADRTVIESSDEDDGEETTLLVGKRSDSVLALTNVNTDAELTPAEIYAANVNSTVGITTSVTTNYFGYQTTSAASGSGFILTSDGYIVTNYHVVEDANEIKVTTYDDTSYVAELVGYDESNDIAVLKIEANSLTPSILGDSSKMNVGDSVVAIGNPLGELTFSLTSGSISALNRKITISNTAMNLIQTDCAINSGNSGGALFNSHGEVIGITNAKYSGNSYTASIDNIGFAIPINSVRDIITSIIENGYIEKPYIGITILTQNSGRSTEASGSLTVYAVEENGPADKAGLKANDVILAVDGTSISNGTELSSIISQKEEGDAVTLTISRDGKTMDVEITLGMRKQSALPENEKITEIPNSDSDVNIPDTNRPDTNMPDTNQSTDNPWNGSDKRHG